MMQSLRDLVRLWTRDPLGAVLTLVGVVLGSASLVFLASALEGAGYAMAHTSQRAAGDDVVTIRPEDPGGLSDRPVPRVSDRDARALRDKEGLPDGATVAAVTLYDSEASVAGKSMPVGIQSGGATWMRITGVDILHGRMLTRHDEGTRRCVIGYDVWERLMGGAWPPASPEVLVDGSTKLTVVGVLRRRPPTGGGGGGETWRVDRKLFVSDATLERAVRGGPHDAWVTLRYERPVADAKTTSLRLKPYVTALHRGVENFSFVALSKGMALDEVITAALLAVLALGGLISITVGGINVMNSQLVTVAERASEFAIRRALGLSARRLRREVLLESVFITGAGASCGALLGLSLAFALSRLLTSLVAPWPFSPVAWSIAASLGVCLIAGVVAGWVPARRAADLPPAVVLRGD